MTLSQLQKLYLDCSHSNLLADRQRAKGYSELISRFKSSTIEELSESVKLSLIAEDYLSELKILSKSIKNPEYRWHMKAAQDCIITYATDNNIREALLNYTGPIDERSITLYLNKTQYKNRIKYSTIHSIYNVMKL